MHRRWFVWVLALLALAACQSHRGSAGSSTPKRLRIAVIPKGTTHEFWKSIHAGAVKAARELDVDLVWKGPLKEDDLKGQIDLVQRFTAQRVSGIVLAPLDIRGLRGVVADAKRQAVAVVTIDSALDSQDPVSFVATNNRAAGRLAGEKMSQLVQGKGSLVVLRYQEGSASTHEREEGFLEAVRRNPDLKIVSDNRYAGATVETAYTASESLLLATGAAKGAISAVFAPNESSTFGMLLALEKGGLAGKLKFVGFDASEKLLDALRADKISGLVVQNPFKMGYLGAKVLIEHLRGVAVAPFVDTGATFIDRSALEDPATRQLVLPDLSPWLNGS